MADHPSLVFHPSVESTVRVKSRQFVRSRSDHDWADIPDIEQAMSLHLLERWHQFAPARGSPCTFASIVLDRWIAQYLRDRGRIKRGGIHHTTPFSQLGVQDDSYSNRLSATDGDRRRWRHTQSRTEQSDLREALGVARSHLSAYQNNLLDDVAMHSVSYAARQRGVSRSQIDREIALIRTICINYGLDLKAVGSR